MASWIYQIPTGTGEIKLREDWGNGASSASTVTFLEKITGTFTKDTSDDQGLDQHRGDWRWSVNVKAKIGSDGGVKVTLPSEAAVNDTNNYDEAFWESDHSSITFQSVNHTPGPVWKGWWEVHNTDDVNNITWSGFISIATQLKVDYDDQRIADGKTYHAVWDAT